MRVIIIHPHDPGIHHVGGVGTFINTFLKCAPSDVEVELVGVTADPQERPVGRWQELRSNGRTVKFLPLVAAHPTFHRRFPLSIEFTCALAQRRGMIDLQGAIVELHRIEPELALRDVRTWKTLFFHTHTRDLYNPKTEVLWKRFPWLYFWLEARLIGHFDALYGVREDIVSSYRERYPQLRAPFTFLPTWVDEGVFASLPERERTPLKEALALQHGFDPACRLLLFVGRFELQKDPILLLDSFRDLLARRPDARLVMIGGGSLEFAIRDHLVSNRLTDRVLLLPPQAQDDIARWMNAADCLCLPSAYEGMPRVVLEALQCGLPVVASDEGETRRVAGDRAVGRLVRERTPEAFSAAFEEILDQRLDRAACQGQVAPYGAAAVLATLFDQYRRLTGAVRPARERIGAASLEPVERA